MRSSKVRGSLRSCRSVADQQTPVCAAEADPIPGAVRERDCTHQASLDKHAFHWTRLSCKRFRDNEVRLQLHALAYNLAILLRCIELPEAMADWSLTSLQLKLIRPVPASYDTPAPLLSSWPRWPSQAQCSSPSSPQSSDYEHPQHGHRRHHARHETEKSRVNSTAGLH